MSRPLTLGFIPLVDAAPLVALAEMGFAREEGLEVTLAREVSWSNIRDKLALGLYDAAHLLAPMALAGNLGLGGPRAEVAVPFVLSQNGDVLCGANRFLEEVPGDGLTRLQRLVEALRNRAEDRPAILGIPFYFSSHHYLLRYWLACEGIDPDRDVTMQVLPPPLMLDAVRQGVVDAFMVGEPWGSAAVEAGEASILLSSNAIWAAAPEKVLGMRRDWMEGNAETCDALLRGLHRACRWVADPGNMVTLSELLAQPHYLDVPAELVERALCGTLTCTTQGAQARIENFIQFHRAATNFPWLSQALWFYDQMIRWGQVEASDETRRIARDVFTPAVYRRALGSIGVDMPSANAKQEGSLTQPSPAASSGGRLFLGPDRFCDSRIFDPEKLLRS